MTDMVLFVRFHPKPGMRDALVEALREVAAPTRAEDGCLAFETLAAVNDPDLFFVHSRWRDEAAFEHHATLPHTKRFVERVAATIDHPFTAVRLASME